MAFDEHSAKAWGIIDRYERFLILLQLEFDLTYKDLRRRLAKQFLNEIKEFKPIEE